MKKLLSLIIVFAALTLIASPAMAITYTGSISTPAGITASAPWADSMVISWTVSQNVDFSWHYDYSFNYELKAISHMIIAISPNAETGDFWDSNHGNLQVGMYYPGGSNPGLPSNFYGLKIDVPQGADATSFWFDSNKAPVWGDFYIKDGKDGGNEVYAYNSTFGDGLHEHDPLANGSVGYKILRPDTFTTTIPEPSTLLLLGSALAMAGSVRRFICK